MLLDGISLLIAVQFLLVGILFLIKGGIENSLKSALSLLLSLTFAEGALWELGNQNLVVQLIISGKKDIIIPPLLFLLLRPSSSYTKKELSIHLVPPVLYSVIFSIIPFVDADYATNRISYQYLNFEIQLAYHVFYLIYGLRSMRGNKSSKQRNYAFPILYILYFMLNVITLLIYCVPFLLKDVFPSFYRINYAPILDLFSYISVGLYVLILFYLVSQLNIDHFFKRKLKTIRYQPDKMEKICNSIIEKKMFTDPNFNISQASQTFNISAQSLSLYLLKVYNTSFAEWLNRQRLEEFKRKIIQRQNNDRFSIDGLARLSGFGSRSTFYRIFKQSEGISPKEYVTHYTSDQ